MIIFPKEANMLPTDFQHAYQIRLHIYANQTLKSASKNKGKLLSSYEERLFIYAIK